MAAWHKGSVDGPVQAHAADIGAFDSRPFPLLLHVISEIDHELARVLERGSPFCIVGIIPQNFVKEPARMPSNDKNSSVHVLNVIRKRFQISRQPCPVLPSRVEPRRSRRDLLQLHQQTGAPSVSRSEASLEPKKRWIFFTSNIVLRFADASCLYTCDRLI